MDVNVRFLEFRNLRPVLTCKGLVNMKTVREFNDNTRKYCKHSHVCSILKCKYCVRSSSYCNFFVLPN